MNKPAPVPGRLRNALLFAGALLFLFEEWLWTRFTRLFAWLGRFGLLRWLDARLVRLPPVAALVVVCIPMLLLFPFKIAGLWMIARGRFFTGCLLMLAAKVASTAVITRIFLTCRPQLLQMPWFARLHAWTGVLRDRVHRWVDAQPAWTAAKRFAQRLRSWRTRYRSRRSAASVAAPPPRDPDPRR